MKLSMRARLLRILATTAVNACVYAVAVTLRMALFEAGGGLFALALFLFTIILAHTAAKLLMGDSPAFISRVANTKPFRFMAFMLKIENGSSFSSSVLAWLIILIPMLTALLIYMEQGVLRALFEILPVVMAYIFSLKHARLASSQIMSNRTSYTGFFVIAICLEVPLIFDRLRSIRPWMFAVSYIFIFAYLIIKNQEDIDSNIFSKKHIERSILPKNLRKVNVLTVSIVFLVTLLLFNLKTVVITLLDWSTRFVFLIIRSIAWLMEQILPAGDLVTEGVGQAEQGFPELPAGSDSPIGTLIFNILKIIVLLYLAYKALFFFVKWVPSFLQKIAELIKRIFSLKMSGDEPEELDFVDETETIKPVSDTGVKKRAAKIAARGIKDLKHESNPVKRVRLMYSIILRMLPAIGVAPSRSDTTMDIINKVSMPYEVSEGLYPLTQIYNQVRYADKKPDGGMMTEADTYFVKVINMMGKTSL